MPTPALQMSLAHDARFLNRLQLLVCQAAMQVKKETVAAFPDQATFAAQHPARAAFAGQVLADPAGKTTTMAITIVGAENLMAEGTGFNDFGDVVTNATDDAIRSQIISLWNAFAGVL